MSSSGHARRTVRPTTAAAPFSSAASTIIVPVVVGPRSAKNTSPGSAVRVSTLQPVIADAGLWTAASTPIARATASKIQGHALTWCLVIPKPLQHFSRHFAVVEMDGLVLQNLVGLVAFAREDHDVARRALP